MDDSSQFTVRDLRRRWKPHKLRLSGSQTGDATNTRLHRAFSWLAYIETMGEDIDHDFALMTQWTALNALYGQWDAGAGEPLHDRECWRVFLERMMELDADGQLVGVLREDKRLVMSIFDDKYLSSFFWKDPGQRRARQSKRAKHDALAWYVEQRWGLILERLVDRIYLVRCQLVHGAATYGGKLNRTAVRRCSTMLGHLLWAMLVVFIDHGAEEDWGIMCYPPVQACRGGD